MMRYLFFGVILWFSLSACHVSYHITHRELQFQDSINLTPNYTLFVRKLGYDMDADQIRLSNEQHPDTAHIKLVELDYLLFDVNTGNGIMIPYVPSYYYKIDKKDKGGLYTKIQSDSTLYVNQFRQINFLEPRGDAAFCLGDFQFKYHMEKDPDGRIVAIQLVEAKSNTNHYLTGTVHLDEAVGSPLRFERREQFDIQQYIPDTFSVSLFQKSRNEKIRNQFRVVPKIQRLYIQQTATAKGIVFKLSGNAKAIFRSSRTNWFSKKRCR